MATSASTPVVKFSCGNDEAKPYGILEIKLVSKDPMQLFKVWLDEAKLISENTFPEAMTLATVRKDGGPSARTVLLRGLDDHGFKMYWDHRSRKTAEIEGDSRGALVFCWTYHDNNSDNEVVIGARQVRIEGFLERLTEEDSTQYFNGEPLMAKLRAITCHQSNIVTDNRQSMISQINTLRQGVETGQQTLNKPDYWGGFRLMPQMMEFYQGQRDAINDRIRFRKSDSAQQLGSFVGENGWVYERLEP